MWTVYVLQHDPSEQLYIGVTSDLKRRIEDHNEGRQTSTIRKSGQWILVYAEAYRDKLDAYEREKKLKHHGSAKNKLRERIRRSLLKSQK